jgi:hypothetical protein
MLMSGVECVAEHNVCDLTAAALQWRAVQYLLYTVFAHCQCKFTNCQQTVLLCSCTHYDDYQVSPPYDVSDTTALQGLRIIVEALGSLVAHGKMGAHKHIIDKPFVPF